MSYRSNLLVVTCVTCFGFAPVTASPAVVLGQGGMAQAATPPPNSQLGLLLNPALHPVAVAQASADAVSLELGDRGQQVAEVQAMLQQLGYYDEVADGVYGRGTRDAVRQFQAEVGLTTNGQVDSRTWERLQQAVVRSIARKDKESPQLVQDRADTEPQTEPDTAAAFMERHRLLMILGLLATVVLAGGVAYGWKRFASSPKLKQIRHKSTSSRADAADRTLEEPTSPPKVEGDRNGHAAVSEFTAESHAESSDSALTSETPKLSETTRLPKLDIVEELIKDLNSPDPRKRRKAIWELGQRGNSKAIQPLVDLMIDSDSTQRSLILASVSEIAVRALKPMNRALLISMQDESSDVRKNAIRDLTRVYDLLTQASQLLRHAVEDPDQEVQDTARWALGQLNRLRSAPEGENLPSLPNAAAQEHLPPSEASE